MINRLLQGRGGQGSREGSRGGRGEGGGMGRGGGNRPGAGPGGNCICPSCGHKISHQVGKRCMDISCPKCGTKMLRE